MFFSKIFIGMLILTVKSTVIDQSFEVFIL